jgi:hypothetical protein
VGDNPSWALSKALKHRIGQIAPADYRYAVPAGLPHLYGGLIALGERYALKIGQAGKSLTTIIGHYSVSANHNSLRPAPIC